MDSGTQAQVPECLLESVGMNVAASRNSLACGRAMHTGVHYVSDVLTRCV